jgi:hypothetical protein
MAQTIGVALFIGLVLSSWKNVSGNSITDHVGFEFLSKA